jgi:hypothetical protein
MNTIIFKYSHDFITPYNLTEYARYITGINDITVEFVKADENPNVDLEKKVIHLPKTDYTNKLDDDVYRITKAYLCHECAHLMYQEEKYNIPEEWRKDYLFLQFLANTIDDLRIENLLGKIHKELRDDFKFLIECQWNEKYTMPPVGDTDMGHGRYGDFTYDMSGSFYWLLQKRYRGADLNPPHGCDKVLPFKTIEGMEQLFENEFVPMLDIFVNTKKSSWEIAGKMLNTLKKNYPKIFATSNK